MSAPRRRYCERLVVNRREQLRPDGLSSRSRTVNSLHPRSPNIRVKFKLLVLSYHSKKTHAAANKVNFKWKEVQVSFLCPEAYFIQEFPHHKREESRKAASLHFLNKNLKYFCHS